MGGVCESVWLYLGGRGETETSCNSVMKLRPLGHIGGLFDVIETHR